MYVSSSTIRLKPYYHNVSLSNHTIPNPALAVKSFSGPSFSFLSTSKNLKTLSLKTPSFLYPRPLAVKEIRFSFTFHFLSFLWILMGSGTFLDPSFYFLSTSKNLKTLPLKTPSLLRDLRVLRGSKHPFYLLPNNFFLFFVVPKNCLPFLSNMRTLRANNCPPKPGRVPATIIHLKPNTTPNPPQTKSPNSQKFLTPCPTSG